MQTIMLKFYVTEKQRHNGKLLYEWLLEQGQKLALPGGSAFRAVAGYGRHGHLHEETFFELAGEMAVQVEFVLREDQAEKLLQALRPQRLNLFYVQSVVETGVI